MFRSISFTYHIIWGWKANENFLFILRISHDELWHIEWKEINEENVYMHTHTKSVCEIWENCWMTFTKSQRNLIYSSLLDDKLLPLSYLLLGNWSTLGFLHYKPSKSILSISIIIILTYIYSNNDKWTTISIYIWNLLWWHIYRVTYVPFIHSFPSFLPHRTSSSSILTHLLILSLALSRAYYTHLFYCMILWYVKGANEKTREEKKNIFSHINKWIVFGWERKGKRKIIFSRER